MRKAGMQKIDKWPIPFWDVDSAIEMMDSYGMDAQLLSLSAPGVCFLNEQEAREMARDLNQFAAGTIRKHPRVLAPMPRCRFRMWMVPWPSWRMRSTRSA